MRFRRSAPSLLIGFVVVVVVAMSALTHQLFSGTTRAVEEEQFALMQSIVTSSLDGARGRALARAQMLADMPALQSALAARDRPRLLAEGAEMFRAQHERFGVDQVQFHVAPAVSFLRLHSPAAHSDDLSSFRPMVVAVNQNQVPRSGYEVARAGPAIFGAVAIHDAQGRPTGSVDVGIEFGGVLDSIKSSFGLEAAVFIDERPLRQFATGLGGDVLNDQNRVGRYMKFHATNWALLQRLARAGDLTAVNEPAHYTREALGVTYGVLLIPLQNSVGQPMGVLAVARDFSKSRAAAGRSLVWQCLFALFAIVLLSGAILVVLRGVLLRPLDGLTERFTALASGDRTQPPPEGLCDELQALATQYETLRTRGEP